MGMHSTIYFFHKARVSNGVTGAEDLQLVTLVARLNWACRLGADLIMFLLLGAWQAGFLLFRRAVRRLPNRVWHLPLALNMEGVALWGYDSLSTWENNIIVGYFTLGIHGLYPI